MKLFLAALRDASADPESIKIRDIAPPLEIPMPLWEKLVIAAIATALVALLIKAVIDYRKNRPVAPPPLPREVALKALEALRSQVQTADPHQFGIAVSDVLRRYVGEQFGIRAERQTSPEFLVACQNSARFSAGERRLLESFLERCDLVKFARQDESVSTSESLLQSAFSFVQGS